MAFELVFPGATDVDGIYAELITSLRAELPDLDLADVDLEAAIARAVAQVASPTRTLLVDRILADYRAFGQTVHDLPVQAAVAATAPTTWTLRNTGAPIIIPADTRLAWPSVAGDVAFALADTLTVEAGVTTAVDVTIRAVTVGATPAGLTAGPLRLSDPLGVVIAVTATAPPTGGADAETAREYDVRLSERILLYGETLGVAEDYAIAARQQPEVGRALALDGYDPDTDTWDNPRTIHIVMADNDGKPLASGIRDSIAEILSHPGWRAQNDVTSTGDPDYTQILIVAEITVATGWDAVAVTAAARQAVYAILSPATRDFGSLVTRDEVFYAIRDTPGVTGVPTLTLNGGTVDVALAGVAGLPTPADDPTSPTTVTISEAA